jgi:hypothetical protein
MEPEVHIIEKYFQEVLHCFTMTNIRCKGGKEIDILAVNPTTGKKYHVESRVSTIFKLREQATKRKNGTSHKDSLDYFKKEKFEHTAVLARIKELFGDKDYEKVLVVHDTEEPRDALIQKALEKYGIQILFMKDIIEDLKEEVEVRGSRDDVMRFVELMVYDDRETHRQVTAMLEKAAREAGWNKKEFWSRLVKLMHTKRRSELFKLLKIDKKTSTQKLREAA